MAKQGKKRWPLKYLGMALLVWAVVVSLALMVFAADAEVTPTGTFSMTNSSYLSFSATNSYAAGNGSVTLSGNTVKVGATGYTEGACSTKYTSTTTLTITNTQATAVEVSYSTSGTTLTYSDNSNPVTIPASRSITMALTSGSGSGQSTSSTITINSIELVRVTAATTFLAKEHGSYTISYNGEALAVGGTYENTTEYPYVLTVTPDEGYEFGGWVNSSGILPNSKNTTYSYYGGTADSVWPLFYPQGCATYYIQGAEGTYYNFLDDAINAAGTSGTIVVYQSGVVCGSAGQSSFTIPSSVKLLIPYSNSDTGAFSENPTRTTTTPTKTPESFRVLTVPSGVTIVNNGSINVNSTQFASSATKAPNPGTGSQVGPYGQLVLEDGAKLELANGSYLYCYGYITGKGQVFAQTGSTTYELMQIQDWIGGNNALDLKDKESFLFSQYYVQNVEAPVTYAYNAKLYVCVTTTLNNMQVSTTGELMGPTGMFRLQEGSQLIRTYDPVTDRVIYDLYGEMATESIEITLKVLGISVDMDSAEKIFGFQNNYTFNIKEGSSINLTKKFKMLPGCEINVEEGATLTVASGAELFIYDVDDWGDYTYRGKLAPIYYSPTKAITRTANDLTSACLRIDGTLVANGAVYSTSGGEGLTGTGVFVNNVSATRTTMPEIQNGSTEVNVNVQPVVGILAGISTSSNDYTKKFSSGVTYYGTPTVVDNNGNILKESAWYQYAVNVAAPAGQDICKGVVAYNADDGGVYSLGGSYETVTIGTTTINNVVGYAASGLDADKNPVSGTFRFKVAGYTVNSIMASNGTLTGPDENGVYSLTGLTTHSTLTIDASDPVDYTLTYVMSGDDYALYTANGGAVQSADTVQIGDETYYVLASYSGAAGSTAPIPDAPTISGRQLIWKYADGSVPNGTIDVNKFTDGGNTVYAYAYGLYQSNTAENTNTGVQYKTLTEALVDAKSGQTVRLLADTGRYYPESGTDWTWPASKTLTIDLNGHTITGTITNNGTMTVDLNGGTLDYHSGATAANSTYRTKAAVTNNGTLTIQDSTGGGQIITDAIEDNGSIANYISVVRNLGTMSIDGVKLTIEQTVNDYSAVVLNYNGGVIKTINNAGLVCTKGYGIVNYGGTIQMISGGSINGGSADTAGRYGIMNRNMRSGSQTSASPYTVSKVGTIETISGMAIYVYQLGIDNYAMINAITGDMEIKSTNGQAVYNRAGWYYDTQTTVATTTESNSVKTTVYTYDTTNYPTIKEISGNVTISSAGNYVFYNYGNINKISGDMTGAGVQIRRDNGAYGLINNGNIDEISGKVTIYTSSTHALAQNLWGTSPRTVGQTYIQKDNDQNGVYTDTGDVREYQYTYTAPVIDQIGGANSEVTISGSGTALYNFGTINTITDGVTITARTSTNAVVNGTSGGGLSTNDSVRTNLGKDSVANRYETRVEDTRTYFKAKIGTIAGNVTIECPKSTGAVVNGGTIDKIGEGVTLKATGSVIQNNSYTYDETQYVYLGYSPTGVFGTSGEGAQTYAFTATTPTITLIDGAVIQATNGSSTLLNGGMIGTIQNSTISATGSYAINNTANVVTQRKIYTDNTLTTEYALTELFDAFFTKDASTGKHTSIAGSAAPNRVDTCGFTPQITTIGMGNVISAEKQTIYNQGQITTIDSGAGIKTTIKSTSTDTSGQAIYNFSCLYNTNTVKDGSSVKSDYLYPANIGTIGSVVVTSGYRALQNGDAGAYLNVINEIGTGAEITSTGNDAVYNASKNAKISSITGGIYTASTAGTYAYNNANTTVDHATNISGGDFKGGTNTDSTLGRAYAIYEPDNTARQTYPEGLRLTPAGKTRTVTFADGTTGSGYYYIGLLNAVAKIVNGSEFTEYASLAAAVDAYPKSEMDGSIYIQMTGNSTEPGFTIDKDVYLDLNGQIVTLTDSGRIETNGRLYGMDSATDGYTDDTCGKIVGTVSSVEPVSTSPTSGNTYVSVQKDDGLSFHRFLVYVSGYRFELNTGTGEGALIFQGTFQGSDTVRDTLTEVGFQMDESGTNKAFGTAAELLYHNETAGTYQFEAHLKGKLEGTDFNAEHTAYALAIFKNSGTQPSKPVKLTYLEALKNANPSLTEDEKKKIEEAFGISLDD